MEKRRAAKLSTAFVAASAITFIAGITAPSIADGRTSYKPGDKIEGEASFYYRPFAGRQAANGTIYTGHAMTVASPTLPLGTVLYILDKKNGAVALAVVTDRGPYVGSPRKVGSPRILDLSYEIATSCFDMAQDGIHEITVYVIKLGDGKYHKNPVSDVSWIKADSEKYPTGCIKPADTLVATPSPS